MSFERFEPHMLLRPFLFLTETCVCVCVCDCVALMLKESSFGTSRPCFRSANITTSSSFRTWPYFGVSSPAAKHGTSRHLEAPRSLLMIIASLPFSSLLTADWISIYQQHGGDPRTTTQYTSFKRALTGTMDLWYAHQGIVVLCVTQLPEGSEGVRAYDE